MKSEPSKFTSLQISVRDDTPENFSTMFTIINGVCFVRYTIDEYNEMVRSAKTWRDAILRDLKNNPDAREPRE